MAEPPGFQHKDQAMTDDLAYAINHGNRRVEHSKLARDEAATATCAFLLFLLDVAAAVILVVLMIDPAPPPALMAALVGLMAIACVLAWAMLLVSVAHAYNATQHWRRARVRRQRRGQ